MARARNIKPGFFKNEDLAECSPWARLCFAGLWTLADREGRLEDRAKRIKGELFPYDSIDIDALLQELERWKFIVRYETEGVHAIQILKFLEHQTPHYSEKPSVIKPPQLQEDSKNSLIMVKVENQDDSRNTPGKDASLRGGRNLLNPSSLNPESLIPSSPPDGGRRPASKSQKARDGFTEFYARYPRKVARADAERAWDKLHPDAELRARIMAALEAACFDFREGGRFIPHPSTWLNAARWDDEPSLLVDETSHHVNVV